MTPGRFATIISGTLKAWGVEDQCVLKTKNFSCLITLNSNVFVEIVYEEQPFGGIWRLREKDQKESVHPSVGAALKSLALILCPNRQVGRVMFAN